MWIDGYAVSGIFTPYGHAMQVSGSTGFLEATDKACFYSIGVHYKSTR